MQAPAAPGGPRQGAGHLAQARADAEAAVRITEAGPPSSGLELLRSGRRLYEASKAKWHRHRPPPPEDEVRTLASYALSCFMVMSRFATQHAVPIVRDE